MQKPTHQLGFLVGMWYVGMWEGDGTRSITEQPPVESIAPDSYNEVNSVMLHGSQASDGAYAFEWLYS